jgi:hypothetical protein
MLYGEIVMVRRRGSLISRLLATFLSPAMQCPKHLTTDFSHSFRLV